VGASPTSGDDLGPGVSGHERMHPHEFGPYRGEQQRPALLMEDQSCDPERQPNPEPHCKPQEANGPSEIRTLPANLDGRRVARRAQTRARSLTIIPVA
jgi:hypothetical protein